MWRSGGAGDERREESESAGEMKEGSCEGEERGSAPKERELCFPRTS